jgi:hypothetical protein
MIDPKKLAGLLTDFGSAMNTLWQLLHVHVLQRNEPKVCLPLYALSSPRSCSIDFLGNRVAVSLEDPIQVQRSIVPSMVSLGQSLLQVIP